MNILKKKNLSTIESNEKTIILKMITFLHKIFKNCVTMVLDGHLEAKIGFHDVIQVLFLII